MQGGHDPLNRCFYPWGKENRELRDFVARLGSIRKKHPVFRQGDLEITYADQGLVVYKRADGIHRPVTVAVNCGRSEKTVALDGSRTDLITGKRWSKTLALAPLTAAIFEG